MPFSQPEYARAKLTLSRSETPLMRCPVIGQLGHCKAFQISLRHGQFTSSLLYGQNDEMIVIVAVAHLRQRPNYWLDRMPSE